MKKSLFLLIAIGLMVAGCSKDPSEDGNVILKSTSMSSANDNLQRPLRLWLFSTPDLTNPISKDIAGGTEGIIKSQRGWLSGHSNYFKDVDPAKSHFIITSSNYDNNKTHLISTYAGAITSDRNESFYYTCTIIVDVNDKTFSGTMLLDGGTGFFRNNSRTLNLTGNVDTKSGEYVWRGTEVEYTPPK